MTKIINATITALVLILIGSNHSYGSSDNGAWTEHSKVFIKTNQVVFPDQFMIGSAYYPEQWPREQWESDFRKMRELGFNVVRMGEFAWVYFEPHEGKFDFAWMDDAIALAAKYGIKTILCTPTASVPAWLHKEHPDVFGANSKGGFTYGTRKGYDVTDKNYLEASRRITTAMAEHYGNNPNVIGWQLDNECGYPFELYGRSALAAFQSWLKNRYQTLDKLNEAWFGAFFGMNYSNWDQIEFPLNTGEGNWNPGEKLDYRRFFSDAFANHLAIQSAILRKYIGYRFIYENWPNMYWSVDPFEAGRNYLDITGWDNYSQVPGLCDYRNMFPPSLNDDLARSTTSNQWWLISERTAKLPAHAPEGALRIMSYLDFAHGMMGSLYWEWRPALGGQEQAYPSILQLDGSFSPGKNELQKLTGELERLYPILKDAKTISDIAVIYSYQNMWNEGVWQREGYDREMERYYKALKTLGRNIDAITESSDFDRYKIIAAPGLQLISESTFAKLQKFVEDGGILILSKQCGIKDTFNRHWPLLAPGLFKDMAGLSIPNSSSESSLSGVVVMDQDGTMRKETFSLQYPDLKSSFKPLTTVEQIELNGAEPLAFVNGGQLSGKPIVTLNHYKKGYVFYVGCDSSDPAFYEAWADILRRKFNIKPILAVPRGMEVVSRHKGQQEFIFLLNYTTIPQTVTLPWEMQELIEQKTVVGTLSIEPLGVRLLVNNGMDL